jgi:hypothetical protein
MIRRGRGGIEHARTKKVGTLEKKKLLREDGGGDAAVHLFFS